MQILMCTLRQVGENKVAKRLGISRQAVFGWTRNGLPWGRMVEIARILAEMSGGEPAYQKRLVTMLVNESTKFKRTKLGQTFMPGICND